MNWEAKVAEGLKKEEDRLYSRLLFNLAIFFWALGGVYFYYAAFTPEYFIRQHGNLATAQQVAFWVGVMCWCAGEWISMVLLEQSKTAKK